jgi:hypothetical protein
MKAVFTSTDEREILRLSKSLTMACALFEIVNNAHRHKETIEEYREAIQNILEERGINIDELLE